MFQGAVGELVPDLDGEVAVGQKLLGQGGDGAVGGGRSNRTLARQLSWANRTSSTTMPSELASARISLRRATWGWRRRPSG